MAIVCEGMLSVSWEPMAVEFLRFKVMYAWKKGKLQLKTKSGLVQKQPDRSIFGFQNQRLRNLFLNLRSELIAVNDHSLFAIRAKLTGYHLHRHAYIDVFFIDVG